MDRFENDCKNLDFKSAAMHGGVSASTALTASHSQIDGLMMQVAEEAG